LYLYFGARDAFVPKRSRNGICWQFLFYVVLQLTLKMRFMRRTGDPASVRTIRFEILRGLTIYSQIFETV